jgi:23S rRNA G2445 N2-methylase RlmL
LSLDTLRQLAGTVPVPEFNPPDARRYLKVTASFLGKRNYSRYDLEEALGRPLATRLGLEFVDSRTSAMPSTLGVRLHLIDHRGILGSSVAELPFHRRTWRVHTLPGLLHPPLAAAMALLADLHPGQVVYDPFAGTGTVLIEAGLRCQGLVLSGVDVDAGTIAIANDHAKRAGVTVAFALGDSAQPNVSIIEADRVLSNPPWGKTVTARGLQTSIAVIQAMVQHLRVSGRLVAVADQGLTLGSCLKEIRRPASLVFPVRMAGCLVDIAVTGGGPVFPENDLGRRLAAAWAQKLEQTDATESVNG